MDGDKRDGRGGTAVFHPGVQLNRSCVSPLGAPAVRHTRGEIEGPQKREERGWKERMNKPLSSTQGICVLN